MDNKEPKRFTSKAEITPINPYEEQNSNQTPHEPTPVNNKSSSSNIRHIPISTEPQFASSQRVGSPSRMSPFSSRRATPAPEYQSPRVRIIPIHLEGSDEPVVPRNVETPFDQQSYTSTESAPSKLSSESAPSKRPSESSSFGSSVPTPGSAASVKLGQSTPFASHERDVPIQIETPASAASAPQSPPPPPPPPAPAKPDPLKQVQEVQQEVDSLTSRVAQFSGASRADKEYLYLDEMLTRNLIKLDIIEVAGNEELRVARKNVIKCIQLAIALLESKVPLKDSDQGSASTEPEGAQANATSKSDATESNENQTPVSATPSGNDEPMETETSECARAVENGEKTN